MKLASTGGCHWPLVRSPGPWPSSADRRPGWPSALLAVVPARRRCRLPLVRSPGPWLSSADRRDGWPSALLAGVLAGCRPSSPSVSLTPRSHSWPLVRIRCLSTPPTRPSCSPPAPTPCEGSFPVEKPAHIPHSRGGAHGVVGRRRAPSARLLASVMSKAGPHPSLEGRGTRLRKAAREGRRRVEGGGKGRGSG
jgi:hypothetical protein